MAQCKGTGKTAAMQDAARVVDLEYALRRLISEVKICPTCHAENECYIINMTALAEAADALNEDQ